MEEEFTKKLVQAKKMCEKTILKLKNSHNDEITSLKTLIRVFITTILIFFYLNFFLNKKICENF